MSEIGSLGLGWHTLTVTQPELFVPLNQLVTFLLVLNAQSVDRKGGAQKDVSGVRREQLLRRVHFPYDSSTQHI